MKTICIKPNTIKRGKGLPAQLLQVRMPDKPHTFLPEYGDEVPYNAHWLRRVKDGSVLEISAQELAKGRAAAKKKTAVAKKDGE